MAALVLGVFGRGGCITLPQPGISRVFSTQSSSQILKEKIHQLAPGLIIVKGAASLQEQISLTKMILKIGEDPKKGFWEIIEGQGRVYNRTNPEYRGRMFGHVDVFPKELSELSLRILSAAAEVDSSLRVVKPTHLIALLYKTLPQAPAEGYIPWHQDNGENDGEADYPVVSVSLGDSCDFLICDEKPRLSKIHPASNPSNLAHRVLFESGDALVFGGKSRLIWHAIHKLYHQTAPETLPLANSRINLTFRKADKIIGKEKEFTRIPAYLPKDNLFYKFRRPVFICKIIANIATINIQRLRSSKLIKTPLN